MQAMAAALPCATASQLGYHGRIGKDVVARRSNARRFGDVRRRGGSWLAVRSKQPDVEKEAREEVSGFDMPTRGGARVETRPAEEDRRVERMFSNLNEVSLKHEPGNLVSAVLLIAGTTVGAGILAIPSVTQESGFLASSVACIGCWLYMVGSGLLVAEVNVNTMCELGSGGVSLVSMAQRTLGDWGVRVACGAYLFIHYALLVAYIARSSDIVTNAAGAPLWVSAALFTGSLGGLCYFGRSSWRRKAAGRSRWTRRRGGPCRGGARLTSPTTPPKTSLPFLHNPRSPAGGHRAGRSSSLLEPTRYQDTISHMTIYQSFCDTGGFQMAMSPSHSC